MSGLYTYARAGFASGALDWTSIDVKVMLLGPDYVPNYAADATLGDVDGSAQLSSLVALTNTAIVAGACTSDFPHWNNLIVTDHITQVVFVQDDGSPDEQDFPLLLLLTQGIGFGAAPAHEDTTLIWDANLGIFSL